eukprot:4994181-Prymnesium_polylepis.1
MCIRDSTYIISRFSSNCATTFSTACGYGGYYHEYVFAVGMAFAYYVTVLPVPPPWAARRERPSRRSELACRQPRAPPAIGR